MHQTKEDLSFWNSTPPQLQCPILHMATSKTTYVSQTEQILFCKILGLPSFEEGTGCTVHSLIANSSKLHFQRQATLWQLFNKPSLPSFLFKPHCVRKCCFKHLVRACLGGLLFRNKSGLKPHHHIIILFPDHVLLVQMSSSPVDGSILSFSSWSWCVLHKC